MSHHRVLPVVAAVAAAALAAGCVNGEGAGVAPSLPASAPPVAAPTPSTPPVLSPEQSAIEAARALVPVYFAASDEAARNPTATNPEDLAKVAIASELVYLKNLVSAMKAQGARQLGDTTVVSITNPRVDLRNDLSKSPPDVPLVEVDTCYDVTKVDVVNQTGKSIIQPDRVDRGVTLVAVANYEYPAPDKWRVAYTKMQEGQKC